MNKIKYYPGFVAKNGLVIIERIGVRSHRSYYKCISACVCKKEIELKCDAIESHRYCGRSCPEQGSTRSENSFIDLTNKKVGKLLVKNLNEERTKESASGQRFWNCVCDCGRETVVRACELSKEKIFSCGCGRLKYLTDKERFLSKRFSDVKKTAKDRNLTLEITKSDYEKIAFSPCSYCGEMDSPNLPNPKRRKIKKHYDENAKIKINGIDRIDSRLGYIIGNIQSCCWKCNSMKNSYNEIEFLEHIKKILLFKKIIMS